MRNSWTNRGKITEEPIVKIVEMENIEKGTDLARQVDAAVEQARKDGTTGRFFKKFMTMNQNNQPTIIVVPIAVPNTATTPTTTTTTTTSDVTGTVNLTPINNRNIDDAEDDDEEEEEEEEIITEEHEIDDDDEEFDEAKATKNKNKNKHKNKRFNSNQMKRKNKNKNKNQKNKKAFNKGINVDIPAQYRKYFNNQKQVFIPASMLQNAKRSGNKNGGKRRIVRRKPHNRN